MDKVVSDAARAVADVPDGATVAVGGFGLSGIPWVLIEALLAQGASDLTVVSNNCGVDGAGLGVLLGEHRIARVIASYVGENKEFARQYLAGELEVQLTPQGTLAEKLRAGGAGVPAFWTPTGVGTPVAEGGLPWRYGPDGDVVLASPPKEVRRFGGRECILEESITADVALVRAAVGDRHGNLVFARAARNFNPVVAMAGATTIAEVERLVEPGEIDPDLVHLPGVFVQHVVALTPEQAAAKRIERRTVRPRPGADAAEAQGPESRGGASHGGASRGGAAHDTEPQGAEPYGPESRGAGTQAVPAGAGTGSSGQEAWAWR